MNKQRLVLILSTVLLSAILCPSSSVFAQLFRQPAPVGYYLENMIPKIEKLAWIIFSLLVLICFITAGILFLTAQGDSQKINTAKSAFIWGVVGIIVGILAYSILTIIEKFLKQMP